MTPRILIVEDDPLIAMDLEAIATEAGAHPTVCASVGEALAALAPKDVDDARPFVLALLDIDVTDGNTFPVARRLIERGIPVTFVSALRRADIPDELSQAPLVAKPYRARELRDRIRASV